MSAALWRNENDRNNSKSKLEFRDHLFAVDVEVLVAAAAAVCVAAFADDLVDFNVDDLKSSSSMEAADAIDSMGLADFERQSASPQLWVPKIGTDAEATELADEQNKLEEHDEESEWVRCIKFAGWHWQAWPPSCVYSPNWA